MIENVLHVGKQDFDGPDTDNYFVPSIEICDDKGNTYCVGLRYHGGSSLDSTSYTFDHANLYNPDFPDGIAINEEQLVSILDASQISLQQLTEVFVARIGQIINYSAQVLPAVLFADD